MADYTPSMRERETFPPYRAEMSSELHLEVHKIRKEMRSIRKLLEWILSSGICISQSSQGVWGSEQYILPYPSGKKGKLKW